MNTVAISSEATILNAIRIKDAAMKRNYYLRTGLFFAFLIVSSIGFAQTYTFSTTVAPAGITSLAGFAGANVENFDSVAAGTYSAPLTLGNTTYSGNGGGFRIDSAYIGEYNNYNVNSLYNQCGIDCGGNLFGQLTFSFTEPVRAIGFHWGASDAAWTLSAYDSSNTLIESMTLPITKASNAGGFVGIVDSGIKYAVLSGPADDWVFVDNVATVSSGLGLPAADAPTIDSIEPGNAQATVSFTPGEDNGSPITGYRYIKDNGFVSSPDFATTGSTAYGIAMDADGNVYTANSGSNTVSKVTPDGTTTTLGTTGAGPRGITVDTDGNVYTSNLDDNTVSKIALDGTSTIVGTTGLKPRAIAVDTAGNVYTANTDSDTVSKITPAGTSTIFGTTGNTPVGIAIDANGNLYTANVDSDTVSKITPDGTSMIFGITGSGPRDLTVDADGNVYTANQDSDDVSKIAPDGTTTTSRNNRGRTARDCTGCCWQHLHG